MSKLTLPTAEQIISAAEARGWTIGKLCRVADIDPAALYKWRADGALPSGRIIQKMLDVLNGRDVP